MFVVVCEWGIKFVIFEEYNLFFWCFCFDIKCGFRIVIVDSLRFIYVIFE